MTVDAIALTFGIGCITVLAGVLAWACWGMYCNERTHEQRVKLLDGITDEDSYCSYRAVTYADHLRALMWLRDPGKLYSEDLWRRAFTPSLPSKPD